MPEPTSTFGFLFGLGDYNYGDTLESIDDMALSKTASGDNPGTNGSYHGSTFITERRVELFGKITGTSQEDTRNKWDVHARHHVASAPQKLVIQGNRWLWASSEGNITRKVTNFRRIDWSIMLYCGDPFYYELSAQAASLPSCTATTEAVVESSLSFTVNGSAMADPIWTFTVSAISVAGGYVQIVNQKLFDTTGILQYFSFYPTATGAYTVYFGRNPSAIAATNRLYRHKVIATSGVPVNHQRRGAEIALLPGDNDIRVRCSGVTVASSTLNWFPRYI